MVRRNLRGRRLLIRNGQLRGRCSAAAQMEVLTGGSAGAPREAHSITRTTRRTLRRTKGRGKETEQEAKRQKTSGKGRLEQNIFVTLMDCLD